MSNNDQALAHYMAKIGEIQLFVKHLKNLTDDHFYVNPDDVNWGHVGDMDRIIEHLKLATEPYQK
jgi:hypothetical protein